MVVLVCAPLNFTIAMATEQKGATGPAEPVTAVAMRVSLLWCKNLEEWFRQLEVQFALARVTPDITGWSGWMKNPLKSLYKLLKEHLLLTELTLDNWTPSQLLREIKQLAWKHGGTGHARIFAVSAVSRRHSCYFGTCGLWWTCWR